MKDAAIVHHADCDGFFMHSVEIVRGAHGMKHAVCVLECGLALPRSSVKCRRRAPTRICGAGTVGSTRAPVSALVGLSD